jgi:glycosyltransferase involved in cell wall biosynthesis
MPDKRYPDAYLTNPSVDRSLEAIYQDLDQFTYEVLSGETHNYPHVECFVALPPLAFDGRFIKGIYFSHGVDAIQDAYPLSRHVFFSVADSLWCNYPWSELADGYFTQYANPAREAWFRQTYPQRSAKALLPLQQADFTNEYIFRPQPGVTRDIDVFCISSYGDHSNLCLIVEALKCYREKYPDQPIKLYLTTGHEYDLNFKALNEWEMTYLRKIQEILIHPTEYIHFISGTPSYENELPRYLSRAKVFLTGQLIGEKSYRMHEAMCCNTPVVCFQQFNQYARGDAPAIPEGAGLVSDYRPEALADTLYSVLSNPLAFTPRKSYLKSSGRARFLNTCMDAFSSYYAQRIPDYEPGQLHENYWLDMAMRDNYQLSLHEFSTQPDLWRFPFRAQGIDNIGKLLQHHYERCAPHLGS